MYTRSYPSRRPLPPDYGGTALTVSAPTSENASKGAIVSENQARTPRRALDSREESIRSDGDSIFNAPFGKSGQTEADRENEEQVSADVFENDLQNEVEVEDEKQEHFSLSKVLDPENIKSDDLLLLGLALLLMYSKDQESDGIPTDALLILGMLYLSGL